MKIVFRLSVFAIAAACLSFFANAQVPRSTTVAVVPRLVNFSGKAVDGQGKVHSGVTGVTFAIYKDQDGGSPLWLESQNVQADAKGNYTAQLGATKPDGLPLDLFTSGEARWLGVTVNGGQEQPRILLLSVPYALKAADAETLGGLPPSAFVLAAPSVNSTPLASTSPINGASHSGTPPPNSAVTGLGTANFLPLWDTTSDIVSSAVFQSGSGNTAKVGINTTVPSSTLDVHGAATVRGNLILPSIGVATANSGKLSQPTTLTASAFNSSTSAAVSQNFRWQAEPTGNNTISPSGTLNLLFANGTNNPKETGLKIANNGQITFANGQVFPGTGTISGVTAGTDLLGGGANGNVTLNVDTTKVPQLATSNNFLGDQTVTGNVDVIGGIGVGVLAPSTTLDVFVGTAGIHAPIAKFGSNATTDSNSILTYNGSGTTEVFQSGCPNCFMTGAQPGDGGMRVTSGKAMFFGDSKGQSRLELDSAGNASQPRTANGMVKAMLKFSPFNGGRIVTCFNSTLSGTAATTPPCGFGFDIAFTGNYVFSFNFQVDDRFLSVTGGGQSFSGGSYPLIWSVCTDLDGCSGSNQEVTVGSEDNFGNFIDQKIFLIVY
jgi:hypothetical protein